MYYIDCVLTLDIFTKIKILLDKILFELNFDNIIESFNISFLLQDNRFCIILLLFFVLLRYLYRALWNPDVTDADRSRYRNVANQIRRLLIYKTEALDKAVDLRYRGPKGLPKIIARRIERKMKYVRKRKEELADGMKVLNREKTVDQKLEDSRERRLQKRTSMQRMIEE